MEYREFTKRGHEQEQTSVWSHFLKAADDKTAKCKNCNEILETEGGSISSLTSHLQTAHAMALGDETSEQTDHEEEEPLPVPFKKGRLNDYFESDESMEVLVSRMVCLDGLTFRLLANSVDLHHLFLESGYELPSSAKAIRSIVLERSEFAKQQMLQEINMLKLRGVLFSVTLNELTSQANEKYIKVNIHSTSIEKLKCCHNIGLIKIKGTTTSTRCAELLNERLELFGLTMKDVVGVTTDSASVMQKMGQTIPAYHQLCYAQGLQLAILDVLYQRQPIMCSECEVYSTDSESSDSSSGEEYDSDNDEGLIVETSRRQVPITNSDCNSVINKVRNVCKLLRTSPTENDGALQKYVEQNFEKDTNLILDCKTLWSSLVSMLEQFIKLYSCIQMALYDLKSEISFSASLAIFKVSLEMLHENDATLLTADFVLKFTLRKLEKTTGPLNAAFIAALRKRIGERYLLIQGVLKYLDDPEGFYNETDVDSVFVQPSQENIVSTILSLLGKSTNQSAIPDTTAFDLAPEVSQKDENISSTPSTSRSSSLETSGKDQFKEEIKEKSMRSEQEKTPVEVLQQHMCPNVIQAEMALYESGGTRGQYLEMAYRQLLSIKPTSVECDRTFSTTAHVCAKFRSRMNYTTINALVILKHCFTSLDE